METHRLQIDTAARKDRPQFTATLWRASAVAFEVGIFTDGAVMSLADVSSVTLRVRKAPLAEAVLLEKTVAAADFEACTLAQWAAGTHQHLSIECSSEEAAITLGSKQATLHVTLSALLASGSVQVLSVGEFIFHDANAVPGEVSGGVGGAITQAEADARYLMLLTQTLTTEQKLQALTNLGLAWLAGSTLANGKVTLATGQTIWVEAAP